MLKKSASFWKVEVKVQVKAEVKRVWFSLNLDLNLSVLERRPLRGLIELCCWLALACVVLVDLASYIHLALRAFGAK
jgi:hypothetical protein